MKIIEKPDGGREIEGTPEELVDFEARRSLPFIRVAPPVTIQPPVVVPQPVYPVPHYPHLNPYITWCSDRSTGAPPSQTGAGSCSA